MVGELINALNEQAHAPIVVDRFFPSLRIWLKLDYSSLDNPPANVRDVTNIGHWGAGNLEVGVSNPGDILVAKELIYKSFEHVKNQG